MMTSCSGFSHFSPLSSPDIYAKIYLPSAYLKMASECLLEHESPFVDDWQLNRIVQAGLEARTIFFAAALHDPTPQELDLFFMDFILRCVEPVVTP
jgi:hypothetical protein